MSSNFAQILDPTGIERKVIKTSDKLTQKVINKLPGGLGRFASTAHNFTQGVVNETTEPGLLETIDEKRDRKLQQKQALAQSKLPARKRFINASTTLGRIGG